MHIAKTKINKTKQKIPLECNNKKNAFNKQLSYLPPSLIWTIQDFKLFFLGMLFVFALMQKSLLKFLLKFRVFPFMHSPL